MLNKIRQAESAIKAGDTKTGFEILRELLAADPDSERAWWIMSGLVQRKQRAACLEQVLRINPENQLARDTLELLKASIPGPESKPFREIPQPPPRPSPEPAAPLPVDRVESGPQTWLHSRRSKIYLTILDEKHLTRAQTEPAALERVKAELKKGKIPDKLMTEVQTITLDSISEIKKAASSLVVNYQDGISERTLRLTLADQETVDKILGAIHSLLGPDFLLKTMPVHTGWVLGISALLIIAAASLTGYLFWITQEVVASRALDSGSVRSGLLISLVALIGPGGAVMVGALILLAALAASAWLLLKPPTVTRLARR